MTRVVRSLRSGQITIPAEFRKRLGLDETSLLQLTLDQGELRIKPLRAAESAAGSPWLKEAYDAFAAARAQTDQHNEAELNAAIDEAVKAVRRAHA
jgi:AbrB family looped-hinge helix DNA binding protein